MEPEVIDGRKVQPVGDFSPHDPSPQCLDEWQAGDPLESGREPFDGHARAAPKPDPGSTQRSLFRLGRQSIGRLYHPATIN